MTIAMYAGHASKMRSEGAWVRQHWFCCISKKEIFQEMTIGRHAQPSLENKCGLKVPRFTIISFVVFLRRGLVRNDYGQARQPSLENKV